jgi:hypothetical protein
MLAKGPVRINGTLFSKDLLFYYLLFVIQAGQTRADETIAYQIR